ncbi:MAG: tetratricopeptide repeat protein [Bacteroidales bacterium]|nr:tetratricopeptide repeat protein [Candidatus Liminaster caballi]
MKKRLAYRICVALLMAVLLVACKSNTKLTRGMAGLTTKYNIHFNGNEAYRVALKNMEEDTGNDDYSQQLNLHPIYTLYEQHKTETKFDGAIDKCKKCVQTKSISKKPRRKAKNTPEYKLWLTRGEYNPYMHNAWLLSGRAQFYNGDFDAAQATFGYVARHFWWKKLAQDESHIWTARIHAIRGEQFEAETELALVIEAKKYNSQEELSKVEYYQQMPLRLQRLFSLAQAEILLIQSDRKTEALPYLQKAKRGFQTKTQRVRTDFFAAQINEENGRFDDAYKSYSRIIGEAKDYKTQFNARIARIRTLSHASNKQADRMERELNRLRRQARNEDYLDQIYAAMADVSLMRKDTMLAIERYETALEKSKRNGMDKAMAALKLGRLTFDRADYVRAQKAYSVVMGIINKEYKGYEEIQKLSATLDELQTHAETVQLQDSLLHLASLSEDELNKVIDKLIDELIKKEKEEAEAEALAAYEQRKSENVDPLAQPTNTQPTVGQQDKSWYFYNPSSISAGKSEFQRKWGARKPEDNWRRKNKTETVTFEDSSEETDSDENDDSETEETDGEELPADSVAAPAFNQDEVSDPHKRAYYLAQIPRTDEEVANANQLIEEGLYNEGKIINEKLENLPLAIKTFENMEKRYPESAYRLESYYAIYLMYLRMGDAANAEAYRQKLIQAFPESAYGIAVADPNYIDNLRAMDEGQDSLYIKTYDAYLEGNAEDVHDTYFYVHDKWPLSKLMPKFLFLHALSYVQEGKIDDFRSALEQLTATYPQSDVSPLSSLMIKGIHEGRQVQSGGLTRGMMWAATLRQANDSTAIDSTQTFIDDDLAPHLLLLAYKTDSLSQNDLLFEIAKFNFENYLIKDFDLEIIDTGGGISVLVISGFANLDELIDYHDRMDISTSLTLPDGIVQIDISEPNFRVLLGGKTFEDYFEWANALDAEIEQSE